MHLHRFIFKLMIPRKCWIRKYTQIKLMPTTVDEMCEKYTFPPNNLRTMISIILYVTLGVITKMRKLFVFLVLSLPLLANDLNELSFYASSPHVNRPGIGTACRHNGTSVANDTVKLKSLANLKCRYEYDARRYLRRRRLCRRNGRTRFALCISDACYH